MKQGSAAARKLWDKETIVYAIDRWRRYGVFPTVEQWRTKAASAEANHCPEPGDEWPVWSVVHTVFGSWSAALRAAGAANCGPGRPRSQSQMAEAA